MIEWNVVKHKDLSVSQGLNIANLKAQHWRYGIESQIRWMRDNLKDDDYHLLGVEQDGDRQILKAYMTLTNIMVEIDSQLFEYVGVGCVCVDIASHHQGIGRILMMEAERFIRNQNKCGILLCKSALIPFYEKCGWDLIRYQRAFVAENNYKYSIMLLNKKCTCTNIKIEKNF